MIDFEKLRKAYQEATGFTVFMEEGELLDFYREKNEIITPVCGTFKVNPITMTAIQKPFIGIVTANITLLASPSEWEAVRDKVNDFALVLNGSSEKMEGTDGETYSVAYNCETCVVGDRILDVAAGVGEVFPIAQTISYIVIEDGVSAYDARLWLDGKEIPILSLVENKVVASSVYADGRGTAGMAAETETYGVDFTTPYTTEEICEVLREAINGSALGIPHCVTVEKNGKKASKIMQFGNISDTVSPPQNIGFNVSLVEVQPLSVEFDGYWGEVDTEKAYAYFLPTQISALEQGLVKIVFFWGDGTSDEWEAGDTTRLVHFYTDGITKHTIRAYKIYDSPETLLENALYAKGLYGATIKVKKDLNADDYEKTEQDNLTIIEDGDTKLLLIEDGFYLWIDGSITIKLAYNTLKAGTVIPFPFENFVYLNNQFKDSFLIDRKYVVTALPKPFVEV